MKPQTLAASLVLFVALCASIAYWGMQLFKPVPRPVAAPREARPEIQPDAIVAIFGGRPPSAAVATNFQLRGVVVSGTPDESVAIVEAQGKPPKAVAVNAEIMPGVVVKEVQPRYITLSESGVTKRVELPANASPQELNQTAVRPPYPVTPAESLEQSSDQGHVEPAPPPSPVNPAQMPAPMRGLSMRRR